MYKNGTGVLIDFGLTTPITAEIPRGAPRFDYSSPQHENDPKRDLWALGIVLYEIFQPEHKQPYHALAEAQRLENKKMLESSIDMLKLLDKRKCFPTIEERELDFKNTTLKFFNENLFLNWEPKHEAERQLQELIRKLLSYAPNERGTGEEAAEALSRIKALAKDVA